MNLFCNVFFSFSESLDVGGDVYVYSQCSNGETCTGFACTVVLNGVESYQFSGLQSFSFDGLETGDSYTISVRDAVYYTADGGLPLTCTVNNCCGEVGTDDVTDVKVSVRAAKPLNVFSFLSFSSFFFSVVQVSFVVS